MTRSAVSRIAPALLCASLFATACREAPPARRYELVGQILSINEGRSEVTIKHQDIDGFMPGMTMPFKVNEPALLVGRKPGDLITATLVVEEVNAYLETLNVTGHEDIDTSTIVDTPTVIENGQPAADAPLVDQNGAPLLLSGLYGHRVALTFLYTRCPLPDYCPLMERHFLAAQAAVKKTPELADVRLLAVTMDPEHDTPDVLKVHAQGLGADPAIWSFATGDPDNVRAFAEQFGVHFERDQQNQWQIIHNLRTVVVAADGTLVTVLTGNAWQPADLLAALQRTPAPVQ